MKDPSSALTWDSIQKLKKNVQLFTQVTHYFANTDLFISESDSGSDSGY